MRKMETFSSQMMFCRTEPEDPQASKALNYLKEKLKHSNLEQITRGRSFARALKVKEQQRQSKIYIVRSNTKQPITFSQYRISSKNPNEHGSSMSSNDWMQRARVSLSEAQLLDVPIVNIQRPSHHNIASSCSDFARIIMEKYYQNTVKYEERLLKQTIKRLQKEQSPNPNRLAADNMAVRTLQRRIRNSRKPQLSALAKSLDQGKSASLERYNTILY